MKQLFTVKNNLWILQAPQKVSYKKVFAELFAVLCNRQKLSELVNQCELKV